MIFDRSPGELSDAELAAAVTAVTSRRNELAVTDPALADRLSDVLGVLVDERDRRRVLYQRMADAVAGAVVSVIGTCDDMK